MAGAHHPHPSSRYCTYAALGYKSKYGVRKIGHQEDANTVSAH